MKKLLCILLCVLIAISVAASLPVSAAESSLIYFDANGWKNFSKIYCHIYQIGGDSFYDWQTPSEECKKVKGTTYSYDLSSLSGTTKSKLAGGMKSGGQYAVLFSANTGIQSYDLTIGLECKGDTAKLTGEQIENPVDSAKKGYEATWESNSSKYGPHLALTSIGNIVGSKLAPGEKGYEIIGDWAPKYYNSTYCDPIKVLAKAYPKFGVKTDAILKKAYAIAKAKVENGDYSTVTSGDLSIIKKVMSDAFKKAYPSYDGDPLGTKTSIAKWTVKGIKNKTYTGKAIKQKIKVVKGSKKATFKVKYSNNKNAGKAKMVITGTGSYKGTIKKTFIIKKAANPVKISAAKKLVNSKIVKYTSCTAKPITVKKAQGKVTYKKVSGSKALTVKSNGNVVVKSGTKAGLCEAKVKVTVKGNKNYKSKTKTVKIKIVVY